MAAETALAEEVRRLAEENRTGFAELRALFRDISREMAERSRDTDLRFKETDERFKETDERFKETDQRFKETDKKIRAYAAEAAERSRLLDERMARLSEKSARDLEETKAVMREVGRRIDQLGGRLGEFAEGLVRPAALELFTTRGIPVHYIFPNVLARRDGRTMEVDLLLVNGSHAVVVEVKSKLQVADVNDHLDRLAAFKTFFPDYARHHVHGAVAGIAFAEGADRYAYRKGLFVIGQRGDGVVIMNDDGFRPQTW